MSPRGTRWGHYHGQVYGISKRQDAIGDLIRCIIVSANSSHFFLFFFFFFLDLQLDASVSSVALITLSRTKKKKKKRLYDEVRFLEI